MRDFRREIETASECSVELAETEFSWSLSRHFLFRRCERAYFLHYYFAQGGWDSGADPVVCDAYAAKKLNTLESWLGSETDRVFRESLDRVRMIEPQMRLFCFRKEMNLRLAHLKYRIPEEGFLNFDLPEEDAVRKIEYELRNSFRCFMSSQIPEILLRMQRSNRINRNMDYEFYLDETRIWQNPGIMWQEPGMHCSFRIHYLPFQEEFCRCAADLFAFYCGTLFHEDMSLSIMLAREGNEWQEFRFTGNAKRGREFAESSIAEMKSRVRPGKTVYIADFPECGIPEICSECRYKTVCSILRESLE